MAKRWRCFFCDEVLTNQRDAFIHFGDGSPCGSDVAACVDPLRSDEKELFKQLRDARELAIKGMRAEERADELEYDLRRMSEELEHHFGPGATHIWVAADRYKNLEFEVKLLRGKVQTEVVEEAQ